MEQHDYYAAATGFPWILRALSLGDVHAAPNQRHRRAFEHHSRELPEIAGRGALPDGSPLSSEHSAGHFHADFCRRDRQTTISDRVGPLHRIAALAEGKSEERFSRVFSSRLVDADSR
jgi:hypothetical protein